MAYSYIKATIPYNIDIVWNTVTKFSDYSWRSDLSKVLIISETKFEEYSKEGIKTEFTITRFEPNSRLEFDIEHKNIKGHFTGVFYEHGEKTTIDFSEEISVKKFYMKPFASSYLRKQQLIYFKDLKKKLGC